MIRIPFQKEHCGCSVENTKSKTEVRETGQKVFVVIEGGNQESDSGDGEMTKKQQNQQVLGMEGNRELSQHLWTG